MKKLRLVFVLVAAAVLLPLLLLVERALSSEKAELALERRAVAERVIDEMERELTTFLRREEDRPFAHYRYLARPDDPVGPPWVRSPLADPLEKFVVGPFQVEPDGRITTPLWPDDERLARVFAGWQESAADRERADRVLGPIRRAFPSRPLQVQILPPTMALSVGKETGQRAGTTVELNAEPVNPPELKKESSFPLEVLEKLNRGASSRADRGSKLSKTQAANVVASEAPALVDLRLEPMVGRPIEGDGMLLYRTVVAGESAFRQGLLLDRIELVKWLADKALGGASRSQVRIEVVKARGELPGGAVFRHRFAEPFSSAEALVTVEVAGSATLSNARLLSGLLVAAVLLGLWAVYRMAAYAVAYAERRGNFVAAVTHELKTPLTAIRMYGEMLRDGMVSDEAKKQRYYQTIIAEGERLSRLVDNVLELARLERKEKAPPATAGEVGPILEEALQLLRPHAEKEGFALELRVEKGLPAVQVDRDALLQVIFNLVDNAIKYSQNAELKKITIAASSEAGEVVVKVEDRGPGVEPAQLRHLFEPFWRGESELTRKTKGTGIGLALVKGLVERMGGKVAARRGEAGGLEIAIRLVGAAAS